MNNTVWYNCDIVTMRLGKYHLIKHAAIVTQDETILWIGLEKDLQSQGYKIESTAINLQRRIVTPGLIDVHTHLVFGGHRSEEFESRLEGISYAEIAKKGGGIQSTVKETHSESEDSLYQSAKKRVQHLLRDGVTTLEIKSGYGLDLQNELKMLRVINQLKKTFPIEIHTTYLAAHALPENFEGDADGYIDYVINTVLPAVIRSCQIDALDAFCEYLAFSPDQVERLFIAAKKYNIPVKLHAEQLSSLHGSTLAANYNALSADHVEYADRNDAKAMAKSGTAAVLLPGAFYMLGEKQIPPIKAFREEGVKMVLASDLNPGTSPMLSLRLALNMGCVLFKLTPEEALAGVTYNAAHALGLEEEIGSLEIGKRADFVAWDITHASELSYWLGGAISNITVAKGKIIHAL